MTEETKHIISDRIKNLWNDPGYSQHMIDVHKGHIPWIAGKTHSEETRRKISTFHKGKATWNKGKRLSCEHRSKLSISHKGKVSPFKGRTHSICAKRAISKGHIGKPLSEQHRKKMSNSIKIALWKPDIRKKLLDALSKTKYLSTSVDVGQLDFITKWNRLGFNLVPNYEVKTDQDLFYVDGYDKQKKVIVEYDSKYHLQSTQKKKDLVRQNKIIDILQPNTFWRYDAVNRTFRNVMKGDSL